MPRAKARYLISWMPFLVDLIINKQAIKRFVKIIYNHLQNGHKAQMDLQDS